ncbi:MAG: response regulator transcription factor [Bacteroidales bacterium]|jgi:DNA-binding NarL/FixJ family response regulator|nr:response regulator transcription factor [Bacteroidales bacterium]
MKKIKILLADDHQLFRNGLKILLDAFDDFEIAGEASNGEEVLKIIENTNCNVVLMDIDMPVMDGIEATRRAIEINPGIKIIALSMYGEEEYYHRMVEAGAKGFILKDSDINEVKDAIITVYNGATWFSQELLQNVIRRIKSRETETSHANLSKREKEILLKICEGLSNQEIADTLFISKRTVDKHRANLLGKTQSKNTASLILYAIKNKIIEV